MIPYNTTPMDGLAFYADLADSYDDLASISPSFPAATLLYNLLSGHLKADDLTVLDVGIGTGLSSEPFADDGFDVTGVDGSQPMLDICAGKSVAQRLLQLDFTKSALPFENGAFDAAFSANTLYLLPAAAQAHVIGELGRVTKAGGFFAFNYEPCGVGELGLRFNDATMDPNKPRSIVTHCLEPQRVRGILAQQKVEIVAADTRIVARKMDGLPIHFETLICRAA
jgi:SAM-dependent methyltransferase